MYSLSAIRGGVLTVMTLTVASTLAQERSQETSPANRTDVVESRMMVSGADNLLDIRVEAPEEVRVGAEYKYSIFVRNATENIVLENVKLEQRSVENFQIENAKLISNNLQDSTNSPQSSNNNDDNEEESDPAGERQQGEPNDSGGANSPERNNGERDNKNDDSDRSVQRWTIDRLNPGETRQIEVTAASDSEGMSGACVAVTSFSPALCLHTRFVKPELEVVKTAPEFGPLCEPLEYAYFIRNDGSGDTGPLTIRDGLNENLKTSSGEEELEFQIDNLEPGATRKFVAELQAFEPGKYSSRASVESEEGLNARSNSTETEVVAAALAIAIDGPEVEYFGRPITYTIRVSNVGEAPARGAELIVSSDEELRILNESEPRSTTHFVDSSSGIGRVPAPAEEIVAMSHEVELEESSEENSSSQNGTSQHRELATWTLETIEPNETRLIRYTVQADSDGEFVQRAQVRHVCLPNENGEKLIHSSAEASTEVISLPALLVTVVDEMDPVRVGDEVVYRIIVANQGTAADENVEIQATLPDALEFVEVNGPTEAQQDGGNISFDTLDRLNAGEKATWTLRARVKESGDVRFKVDLSSKNQNNKVRSEEPTRLFDEQG